MAAPADIRTPSASVVAPRRRRPRRGVTQPTRGGQVTAFVTLVLGSFVFAYPFLWMIATSLRTRQGIAAAGIRLWPVQWHVENYADGLQAFSFWRYLGNSVISTLVPVVFTVLVSSIVGFAFARIPARGAGLLFGVVLSTMLLPGEVTLVPQFILFRTLDMMDTLYPLILPSVFGSAFFIFLFRQFYLRLPQSLTDAAIVDGAGWFRIWRSIYLPLSQPIVVAAAVLQFMGSWNNFMTPAIYLSSDRWKTLPLALAGFQSANSTDTGMLMAVSIVVILPCIVLFFAAQRHIVGGISFTGSK